MDTLEGASTLELNMLNRAQLRSEPITGSMELLPLCNMNCDMCFVRLSRKEMEAQGRLRTGEEWLSLGKQMAEAGTLFLLLTGGEPLLHPDFKGIYLGLKKLGLIVTLNTNATLIDEQWAAFFGKHKPRRINITLYGSDNETYANLCHYPGGYDRVVNAVRMLRENGVDVKFGCSVTPKNVQDIEKMHETADSLGVPISMDTYMMPGTRERTLPFHEQNRLSPEQAALARMNYLRAGHKDDTFVSYARQMIARVDSFEPGPSEPCPISCRAGRCSFTINWQGMMRPCVILTEPQVNVFEVGFAEGWKQISSSFQNVRYCAKCSNCRLRFICRSCAAASKLETGEFLGTPEYLCRYSEEFLRLLRLKLEETDNE